jgi:hypothetical protein
VENGAVRTHRVVDQRSPAALPRNGKYVCIGIEIWDQAGAAVTREYLVGCAPIRRRILGCVSPWPAFIGRMQSPRYVHSRLSRASDDSERSSVTMPAERSADSSLGTIPRNGVSPNLYERRFSRGASIPACVLPSSGERVIMTSMSPHVDLPLLDALS